MSESMLVQHLGGSADEDWPVGAHAYLDVAPHEANSAVAGRCQRSSSSPPDRASRCRAHTAPKSTADRASGWAATYAPQTSRAATCSWTASASTCSWKYVATSAGSPRRSMPMAIRRDGNELDASKAAKWPSPAGSSRRFRAKRDITFAAASEIPDTSST